MMETTGFGWGAVEFLLLFFSGQFFGLVPGERDPQLIKSAPPHAYYYQEWTSSGPGQAGAPGIKGLVADPEIQGFCAAIRKSLSSTDSNHESWPEGLVPGTTWQRDLPELLTLASQHAGAAYLAHTSDDRDETPLSGLEAAVILNLGDDADEFLTVLNRLLQFSPGKKPLGKPDRQTILMPMKSLLLHQIGGRVIVTTGPAALDRLLARWEQADAGLRQLPEFVQAWQGRQVTELGGLTWINAAALWGDLQQKFGLPGSIAHNVAHSLGLSSVQSVLTVSGLDQQNQVCRTNIALSGERGGLLRLFSSRALASADFASVPADADFVLATNLNLETVREVIRDIVAKTLPEAVNGVNEFQKQLEQELQLSLDDIVAGFGDVWTIHDAPSNGGVLLTGMVAGVPVRDKDRAQQVVSRLKDLLIESLPHDVGMYGARLEEFEFQGTTIYSLLPPPSGFGDGSEPPLSWAFCLTDSHLWLALHPQALKAQLRFLAAKEPRFDAASKLKLQDSSAEQLTAIYIDTPGVGRAVYPLIPFALQTSFHGMRELPLAALPSARAVLPYLQESTILVGRNDKGIMIESTNALPVMIALSIVPHLGMRLGSQGDVMLMEGRNAAPENGPAVNLGAAEGDVVQAKVEEPPKPAAKEPSALEKAARRALPFLLRDALPDQVESLIPPVVFERLAEPPDPEKAAQRAKERQQRREERARRRAIRRGAAP